MEFRIRKAGIEDAPAIAFVQLESWKSTYAGIVSETYLASLNVGTSAQKWREWLGAGNFSMFVAESSAGVIGFASGGILRDAILGYDAELYAIYLLREHQGRGVGRLLVHALVDSLRAEGFGSMVAWVLEKNPAVSFYMHLGGIQIAHKPIEIGGASLEELAFGWPSLDSQTLNQD